jgi:hypothetical protein
MDRTERRDQSWEGKRRRERYGHAKAILAIMERERALTGAETPAWVEPDGEPICEGERSL